MAPVMWIVKHTHAERSDDDDEFGPPRDSALKIASKKITNIKKTIGF